MSVPNEDSAFWFVFDRQTRKSHECESMETAAETAKLSNTAGHLV